MADINSLCTTISERFAASVLETRVALGELTVDVKPDQLHAMCRELHDHPDFDFKMLIDVCGVDYLHYGLNEQSPFSGRFAVVYHLLSVTKNQRIRLRAMIPEGSELIVDSVIDIWQSADWFEREVFDLFGILFRGHPDLRRILTDYGFVGHPFRKDFPLIGKVEARYDATLKRVVYEPVSIQPRILEPRVIRHDNRYLTPAPEGTHGK